MRPGVKSPNHKKKKKKKEKKKSFKDVRAGGTGPLSVSHAPGGRSVYSVVPASFSLWQWLQFIPGII
jgi:hypothetical protein